MSKKVSFAPDRKIETFQPETDELLRHIASILKDPEVSEEEWLNYAFVSDESRVGDFFYQDAELDELRGRTGIPDIQSRDLICDLAAIMRNKNRPH